MASATATVSTLCASFGTHCTISHNSKAQFSQPSLSRFSSQSSKLSLQSTFLARLHPLPLPKASEAAVAESETSPPETETTQIVQTPPGQAPTWEKGLFAVVMVSTTE